MDELHSTEARATDVAEVFHPFRALSRFVNVNGQWYFSTREGDHGPFASEQAAHDALDRCIEAQFFDVVEDADEAMIIGGGMVYHDFMPLADRIYLTRVQAEVEGDTHFPEVDEATWQLVSSEHHAADDGHRYAFDVMVFERRRK